MTGAPAETLAVLLLAVSLVFAVARPLGLAEAVVAVPAAAAVVALGIVPRAAAWRTLREIGPTVGFLAAILVFGHLCAEAGVFSYLGDRAARLSRGEPHRLLVLVVALAAMVTATLTLDATVVLLTPVVLASAGRLRIAARPHLYACARLANSGSLLLPVSNLTNLLAFSSSGLSFGRFAALMALPWVVVVCSEWLGLRLFFRGDLGTPGALATDRAVRMPRYALAVSAATVGSFVVASSFDVSPAWAALAGCIALLVPRMRAREIRVRRLVTEASPGFCAFVLALAVVVDAVNRHGLHRLVRHAVPAGSSLGSLLVLTLLAALLANVLNNLPATLVLVPLVASSPAAVLAVLLGVNIGPNATFSGSLATLLWRRQLPAADKPDGRQFHLLGLLSVPALLAASATALWVGVRLIGA